MSLSATALRCKRARSWMKRLKDLPESDLDARFIFSWIALNALYGQAKYRQPDGERTSELKDLKDFVRCMIRLDNGALQRALRSAGTTHDMETLLHNRFLTDVCWKKWDAEGIVERVERLSACEVADSRPDLITILSRLYVLRKQLFHGCSTDRGTKNRASLIAAVPLLERMVRIFIGIVEFRGRGEVFLQRPPYPPSQITQRG